MGQTQLIVSFDNEATSASHVADHISRTSEGSVVFDLRK